MTGTVLALIDDVMVATRVAATLDGAGYVVRVVGTVEELRAAAEAAGAGSGVAAVVLPFAARGFDAPAAIRALRADAATAHLPIVAFGPHVDTAGQAAAREAGATRVVANSAFFARMAEIVGG